MILVGRLGLVCGGMDMVLLLCKFLDWMDCPQYSKKVISLFPGVIPTLCFKYAELGFPLKCPCRPRRKPETQLSTPPTP